MNIAHIAHIAHIALVAVSVVMLMTVACAGTVNMMRLLMRCRLRSIC